MTACVRDMEGKTVLDLPYYNVNSYHIFKTYSFAKYYSISQTSVFTYVRLKSREITAGGDGVNLWSCGIVKEYVLIFRR